MRRRDLIRQAAILVPLAAACAPAPVASPTPTPAPATFRTPTFIAFQGPKPDIDGNPNGLPPGYNTFPKSLVSSVASPPGKGGDVTILTFTNAPAPVALDQNGAWQEINKKIGANLKINAVGAPDYLTKLNTSISGGDIADIFYASVIGTGLQNMPDFLASQCADLTPFLSGDASKEFPNLAAFPGFRWPYGVFNGKLYAVPAATITGQALLAKGRILDDNGIGDFKIGRAHV